VAVPGKEQAATSFLHSWTGSND